MYPMDPGLMPYDAWCNNCGETVIDLRFSPHGWCGECLEAYLQDAARRRQAKEDDMDPFLLEGLKYGDLPLDITPVPDKKVILP